MSMIRAYSELYLNDAKSTLATCFDYMINTCALSPSMTSFMFVKSGYADLFAAGNPSVISGMSGIELAYKILEDSYSVPDIPEIRFSEHFSPEYWTGWSLAWYQWYSNRRFRDIFRVVALKDIIAMYSVFHEEDITSFFNAMDEKFSKFTYSSNLKQIRENRGFSQAELASETGINLRSIQMYEQGHNDINKAQAQTLYRLSGKLDCKIEDLLENPQ